MTFKRSLALVLAALCLIAAKHPSPSSPSIQLDAGSGRVITLTGAAASVFAADPKVVEVRPASPTTLFLFGVAPGRTTVAAMSSSGQPIAQMEVTVGPSGYAAAAANGQIAAAMPASSISSQTRPNGLRLERHGRDSRRGRTRNGHRSRRTRRQTTSRQPHGRNLIRPGQPARPRGRDVAQPYSRTRRQLGRRWLISVAATVRWASLPLPALVQAANTFAERRLQ